MTLSRALRPSVSGPGGALESHSTFLYYVKVSGAISFRFPNTRSLLPSGEEGRDENK